jgi:segregation and condensation protein B
MSGASLKPIVECLLFLSDTPLSIKKLREIIEPARPEDIKAAIDLLIEEYNTRDGGFRLKEVAGGYQFRSRPEFKDYLKRLKKVQISRLSKPSLETLSIIAYKQPIMKAEVERIRGVDCSGVLRYLLEKDLISIVGRKNVPGRPFIYGTTTRFLEMFDLKDLSTLPTLEELKKLDIETGENEPDTTAESTG